MKIKQIDSDSDFVNKVAHILMSEHLSEKERLNCIRLIYKVMAWPEIPLTDSQAKLLDKIYGDETE